VADAAWRTLQQRWETTHAQDALHALIAARYRVGLPVGLDLLDQRRFAPAQLEAPCWLWVDLDDGERTRPWGVTSRISPALDVPEHRALIVSRQRGGPSCTEIVSALRGQHVQGLELRGMDVSSTWLPGLVALPDLQLLTVADLLVAGGPEQWRFLRQLPRLHSLRLEQIRGPKFGPCLDSLAAHPSLARLHLEGLDVRGAALACLAQAPSFERLDLVRCARIEGDGLLPLAGRLKHLRVDRCPNLTSSARGLDLAALTQLRGLELFGIDLRDVLPRLAGLAHLEQLTLFNVGLRPGPGAFKALSNTPLRRLELWGQVGGRALGELPATLRALTWHQAIHEAELAALLTRDLDSLEVTIENTAQLPSGRWPKRLRLTVSGLLIGALRDLPGLGTEDLDLALDDADDDHLAALAPLDSLQALTLSNCRLATGAGLSRLAGLTRLRRLTLHRCPGIQPRALPQALESLSVHNAGLDDRSLQVLSRLPSLRTLELTACPDVTDAGLRALEGAGSLRALRLAEDIGTPEARAQLRAALPQCRVLT
jgi:hypothetical protein